jgi:DNA-binding PadR family transcriptional regulator
MRGAVPIHVLHHAAEGEVHGAWMAEELARHGYKISPGTLYPLLHRMESSGLLTSRTESAGGRMNRLYRATREGMSELERVQRLVGELAGEVVEGQKRRHRNAR